LQEAGGRQGAGRQRQFKLGTAEGFDCRKQIRLEGLVHRRIRDDPESPTKPKVTGSNPVGRIHRRGWIPLNTAEFSKAAGFVPIGRNPRFALSSRIGQSLKRAQGLAGTASKVRGRIKASSKAGEFHSKKMITVKKYACRARAQPTTNRASEWRNQNE
jgi:hypothetical protein